MVDPGAAQVLIKQLNRWYRKRAKPHGLPDYYHRGTRMEYTAAARIVSCVFASVLLSVAAFLWFAHVWNAGRSPTELLTSRFFAMLLAGVGLLPVLKTFRDHTIVTEDALFKCNLFGRRTRMAWDEIAGYKFRPDDNLITFSTAAKAKLTMSLSYDGWQDFMSTARWRMNPALYWQLACSLASLDAKRPAPLSRNLRWPKWLSLRNKNLP